MKKFLLMFVLICFLTLLTSCKNRPTEITVPTEETRQVVEANDTIYQLLVYAFADSNGDGLGDFKGIYEHIDYFEFLGIDSLWLSPIHPSPSYHGYDIIDYYQTKEAYVVDGYTFEQLIIDLKEHDIDVIMDIALNHASNQHPYFKEAINAYIYDNENEYIDYFEFSKTPFTNLVYGYSSASSRGVYYDGFYGLSSMPSWNFDHQPVRDMFLDIFKYWLDLGVAGFRLDASKHIYDSHIKNIQLLKMYKQTLEETYENVFFVNEVWSSENEIIQYYESEMNNLDFTFKDYAYQAVKGSIQLSSYLEQFQKNIRLKYSNAREVPFLSNHDIGRLGEDLSEDEHKMLASLLILAPGNAVMYYGDEIMLRGTRNLNYSHQGYEDAAYRTPMLWNDDSIKSASYIYQGTNNAIRNAITTSTITVEDSMQNSDSLLHHYQKIIELKKNNETISKGSLERVHLDDRLITYQITDDDKTLLVIHNITNQAIFSSLNKAFSLLDYVSLTTPFVSVDQMLNIPAMSSVILELEEPLELPNTPLIEDVYIRGSLTNWSLSSIYKMLYENDQYTYELNIDEVTEFKLFKSDVWYGYDALVMPDSSYLTKEVLNGNIVIQPGNYLLIFKNGNITITQK